MVLLMQIFNKYDGNPKYVHHQIIFIWAISEKPVWRIYLFKLFSPKKNKVDYLSSNLSYIIWFPVLNLTHSMHL